MQTSVLGGLRLSPYPTVYLSFSLTSHLQRDSGCSCPLLHSSFPKSSTRPLEIFPCLSPLNTSKCHCPVYLSPHWQLSPLTTSLPAPAPPGSLEGNAGEGSGPPFCLRSRRGRGWEGITLLPHIPSMLSLMAVTHSIHITRGRGLILQGGLWMPRKRGLLSGEVHSPSLQKYVARGSVFRSSSKCHCLFLAWLCDISNIKYYLWNFLLIAV